MQAEQESTKAVIDEWNAGHPEIQVEYVQGDWGTADQELLTSFETGDVPDIFHYWTGPIMLWKARGYLADLSPMLDEAMKNDVNGDVWNLYTTPDNRITALPFQMEVDMIFYNKDLFAEKGIPVPALDNLWTLDDMIEAARKLNDPERGIRGIAIAGLGWSARYINDSWATKIGVSPLVIAGDTYSINVDGEYRGLIEKILGLVREGIMDPGTITGGYDIRAAFTGGQLAIYAGSGCFERSAYLHEYGSETLNWGMLPPVKIKSTQTYGAIQTLSIPEKSKNKAAAMEFLKFFWNANNQERIAQSAYIFPGRSSAIARFNKPEDGWDLAYESAKNLIVPNYIPVPGWGTFMETTGRMLWQEYMIGQDSFETFKEKLNSQLIPFLYEARQ
jgi:ABC-type glycerol-3-phosphate transport system substrate-binding protein